jgi:hypothetical protein
MFPGSCQSGRNTGAQAGLAGAAFSGNHRNDLSHGTPPLPFYSYNHYNGITHKYQEENTDFSYFFHHFHQKQPLVKFSSPAVYFSMGRQRIPMYQYKEDIS